MQQNLQQPHTFWLRQGFCHVSVSIVSYLLVFINLLFTSTYKTLVRTVDPKVEGSSPFGTSLVIAVHPVRKPTPKMIKQNKLKIDEDGVCRGFMDAGKDLSDVKNENRFRFHNIMANRLNTRRAIREMVFPHLLKLEKDIDYIRNQLDQIQQLLVEQSE